MAAPELLPRPGTVLTTLWQMAISGELLLAIRDSVTRVLVGYAVGVVAGVVTGLTLGAVRALNDTIGVIFDFAKGIPPIALVPVVIIWLGIGETSKYVVIAYIVWIVVAISTAVGAREVPLVRLRAGAFFGLSRLAIFWRIILPSCLPYVLAGMRSAIGFAFVALVSAELIAANSGIGQVIMDARFALQTSRMIVGLFVLGVLGALAQALFDAIVARSKIAAHF
jgi:ABC-type nitrate/sulfonate/bicarbonate transport system permease component